MKKLLFILAIVFTGLLFNSCEKETGLPNLKINLEVEPISYIDYTNPDDGHAWRFFTYGYEITVTGGTGEYTMEIDCGGDADKIKIGWQELKVFKGKCYYSGAGTYTITVKITDFNGDSITESEKIVAE